MIQIPSTKRTGLTLLEVLITIFVMAIGFLSVLTLFPLAARKIIRSIDSDRASLISGNSGLALNVLNFKKDAQFEFDIDLTAANLNPALASTKFIRSKYVHIDPISVNAGYVPISYPQIKFLPPISISGISFDSFRELLISQDEMQFTTAGKPESGFRRTQRYSTSFLFSRGQLNDPDSINCLTLVYVGRPLESGSENQQLLNIQPSSGLHGSLEFTLNGPLPTNGPDREFGRNSWILDITSINPPGSPAVPEFKRFYQVQNVEPLPGNQFKITLDKPLDYSTNSWPRTSSTGLSQAIWIDYLFEIFDRGTGQ